MQGPSNIRRGCIASVFSRLVVATFAGVVAAVFWQLLVTGIILASSWTIKTGAVGGMLFLICPVIIASLASALTFHFLSRRLSLREMPFRYTVPRYGRRTCLGATVPLFCGLLFISPFVLEAAGSSIWGSDFIGSVGSSETLNLILLLASSFLLPYLAARVVYARLRWRQVASAVPLCQNCLYNLTGNVSGICPECGTPIPEAATDSQPDHTGRCEDS